MMEMVRYIHACVIALVVAGILLAGIVNPVSAVGTMSDGYEYNNCILIGQIYEHNPVTMQNSPKAGVIVRLYGTDNTAGLHTTHLVKDLLTDSNGYYKFTISVGTMTDSTGTLLVRSAYPYYQIAFYNDAGSEYEIYDINPLCGSVGETLGSGLKWVNIDIKAKFGWTKTAYLFPCTTDFYVHKKGQPLTVTAPAGTSMGEGQVSTDLLGNNYRTQVLTRANPKDCSDWCLIESQCRAATYVKPGVQGSNAMCWLKTSVPASSSNTNTISFIKYDSSNPLPTKVLEKFEYVDLKGSDLYMKNIPSGDPEDCAQLCLEDSKCYSATYVLPGTLRGEDSGAVCFLKSAVPSLSANLNTISWVKHDSDKEFGWSCWAPSLTPGFTAVPSSGKAPLTVTFTDTSLGASSRNWDLDGDGDYDNYDTTTTYTYTSPGTYNVRLTVGGCPDNFKSVTKDIIVEDIPVTNVGGLSITSNPSAANVYLDSNYMGTTPYDSSSISSGSHTVRLSMTGYLDASQLVEVTAGNTAQLFIELLPDSNTLTGTVVLDSMPAGAIVSIDGTPANGVTPLTVSGVAPGTHIVRLSETGYLDASQSVEVTAGNTAQLFIELLPDSDTLTGTFVLDSMPAGATVSIDGTPANGVTPMTVSGVAPGTHTVVFSRSKYEPYSRLLRAESGEITTFTADLVSMEPVTTLTTTRGTDIITTVKPPGFIWIGALAALAVVVILRVRKNE
jgi:PKD repeat protein